MTLFDVTTDAAARSPAPSADAFFSALERQVADHPALRHPFLLRFAEEPLSRQQIARFAAQHYSYSRLFTRNLAAVIANVPDERARGILIANLYEEIGEPKAIRERAHLTLLQAGLGSARAVADACVAAAAAGPEGDVTAALVEAGEVTREQVAAVVDIDGEQLCELTHAALFRRFLRGLGVRPQDVGTAPIPETAAFIREYHDVARSDEWLVAMGAMGPGTECVVPTLYRPIERGIRRSGVVAKIDYVFWTIHIHCDDGHGANIVSALKPHATTGENQALIARGATRVLDARARWFDGLERLVFDAE